MPSLTKIQTGFMEAQGALPLSSGTAAAPGLKFSDHAGTGMFSPSTGVIGFSTSNKQNALTIHTDGSVVIDGTTSNVVGKLTVAGDGKDIVFGRTESTGTGGTGRLVATGNLVYVQAGQNASSGSSADLIFCDYGGVGERLRITTTGELISTNGTLRRNVDTSSFTLSGGTASNSGANIVVYGNNHSSEANVIRFRVGGTEKARITSNGHLFVAGTGGMNTTQLPNGSTINVNGTSSNDGFSVIRYSSGYGAYGLNIGRSKSNTLGTNAAVLNGNELGHITFYGADGTDFNQAAQITAQVDGDPSDGTDMPGRLIFRTSPDGSATPTERLRISSTGKCEVYKGTSTTGKTSGSEAFTVGNGAGNHRFAVYPDGSTVIGGNGLIGSNNTLLRNDGMIFAGAAHFTANITPTSGRGIEIFEASTGVGQISSYDRDNSSWDELRIKSDHLEVFTGSSNKLSARFNTNGSLTLYVNNASHQTHLFTTGGGNAGKIMLYDANGTTDVQISTDADSWFQGGKLAVGHNSPDCTFHVRKDSSDTNFTNENTPSTESGVKIANLNGTVGTWTALTLSVSNGSTTQNGSLIAKSVSSGSRPEIHIGQRNGDTTESRITINSSGNVGISDSNPTRALSISGSMNLASGSRIESYSSSGNLIIQGGSTYPGGHIQLYGGSGNDQIVFATTGATTTQRHRMTIGSTGQIEVSNTVSSNDAAVNIYKATGDNSDKAILRVGYDAAACYEIYRIRNQGKIITNANQSGADLYTKTNDKDAMVVSHDQTVHVPKFSPHVVQWGNAYAKELGADYHAPREFVVHFITGPQGATYHLARLITQPDWGHMEWTVEQVFSYYSPSGSSHSKKIYTGWYSGHTTTGTDLHANRTGNFISTNQNLGPGGTHKIHEAANGGYYRDAWATDYYASLGAYQGITLHWKIWSKYGGSIWDSHYTAQQVYPAAFNSSASQSDADNWNFGRGLWVNTQAGSQEPWNNDTLGNLQR